MLDGAVVSSSKLEPLASSLRANALITRRRLRHGLTSQRICLAWKQTITLSVAESQNLPSKVNGHDKISAFHFLRVAPNAPHVIYYSFGKCTGNKQEHHTGFHKVSIIPSGINRSVPHFSVRLVSIYDLVWCMPHSVHLMHLPIDFRSLWFTTQKGRRRRRRLGRDAFCN
jgi:hypothetical protein